MSVFFNIARKRRRKAPQSGLVAGYYAWWNTDTLAGSYGSSIATWTDSSSNAFAANATAGYPVLVTNAMNGHSVAAVSHSSYFSVPSPFYLSSSYCALSFVMYYNGNNGVTTYLIHDGSGGNTLIDDLAGRYNIGLNMGDVYGNTISLNSSQYGLWYGFWNVITFIWNGSASAIRVNGTQLVGGTLYNANFNTIDALFAYEGYVGDTVIYNTPLTLTQIQANETWLRNKYGI